MIKVHHKYFIESIPNENINPDQTRTTNHQFRNNHNIKKNKTRFQIYPEGCKYNKPICKTKYSEILVKYENGFDMNTGNLIVRPIATSHSITDENSYVSVKFQKNAGRIGGKLKPQDTVSTPLQELSLMNSKHFGALH